MIKIPTTVVGDILKKEALETLRRYYGYSTFRPGQWEVIENILRGHDTVVLMPTGGGKSLCFQLPALMAEGCCIVVSPLIALMNDQVTALVANGLPAGAVNSMNFESENKLTYERAVRGELKLLYISPERLISDIEAIKTHIKVSFVAVDEAHCISQWGHDFRPVYTSLTMIKESWPEIPVMALTATADRLTREDISKALSLKDPYMFVGSFDRPNLSLRVIQGARLQDRVSIISSLINMNPMDCGIVYCLSRRKTEDMAKKLTEKGYRVGCYHAGMTAADRERVQREFVGGELQAICATVAFGMGIDKSNIRWVVHNNIPGNIESYYQEIGRAGRDGLPAETILFYSYADIITRRSFAEESGQQEINESKLEFMQRYAEASVCRRRILLSYFSEETDHDCGNCDNCRNPKPRFDGTELAQKALSAVIRTGSSEPIGVIIEILRGMKRHYILDKGYDRLRTFGVGHDISAPVWHAYILQMIQLGLLEVAYDEHFHLRPTAMGLRVVKGEERIELARYIAPEYEFGNRKRRERIVEEPVAVLTPEEKITEELKALRAKLAKKKNIADYMVFSDVSIAEMSVKKPLSVDDLAGIEGMSAVKLNSYYKEILMAVLGALGEKRIVPRGSSNALSRLMFASGMSVEEMAQLRGISESTIIGHLAQNYSDGYPIDIERIIKPEKFAEINTHLAYLDTLDREDSEAYAAARDQLLSKLREEYGFSEFDIQAVRGLRQVVEVVDGKFRRLPKKD